MHGVLIKDWNDYDHTNPEHRSRLMRALRFRIALQEPVVSKEFEKSKKFLGTHKQIHAALKAFTTTGDFPVSAIDVIEKFHVLTNYDNGYEQIFDVKDFTGTTTPGFRMTNVQSGMTFERVPIGDKIKLKQMSGTQEFVFFDYYGGGLNWHRSLFENQEYWTIEDTAMEFVNKAYARRSEIHYALLEAALDLKTCITLTDPGCNDCSEYARAVAIAINTAIARILYAVQNKGYGATPSTIIKILAPLELMGIVKEALNVRLQHFTESQASVNYTIQPIYTMMLTNRTRIGVFLPKMRIKSGNKMNLKTFSSFDMLSYSEGSTGWMSYGAAVGDLDQIECIDATQTSGIAGA